VRAALVQNIVTEPFLLWVEAVWKCARECAENSLDR